MSGSLVSKARRPGVVRSFVYRWFFNDLIRNTRNFDTVRWFGNPTWQNVLDLWNIQEAVFEVRPELIIETGTNRGGSSYFYGQLLDLMGTGEVITVDVEKMHDLRHPRVTYLIGSSVEESILGQIQARVNTCNGPVMVILDSDHSQAHVAAELKAYSDLVTPGSYMLVQDGVIDTLYRFRKGRPGPLPAIREFLKGHEAFSVDRARCDRFLVTHHPDGWLKRSA